MLADKVKEILTNTPDISDRELTDTLNKLLLERKQENLELIINNKNIAFDIVKEKLDKYPDTASSLLNELGIFESKLESRLKLVDLTIEAIYRENTAADLDQNNIAFVNTILVYRPIKEFEFKDIFDFLEDVIETYFNKLDICFTWKN
jgi:hypothetical protein